MKNRKYIILGIIFFVITIIFCNIQFFYLRENFANGLNVSWALKMVLVAFTLLGISELFFIKAKVVPKLLRIIIYWQWIQVPVVIILCLISLTNHTNQGTVL